MIQACVLVIENYVRHWKRQSNKQYWKYKKRYSKVGRTFKSKIMHGLGQAKLLASNSLKLTMAMRMELTLSIVLADLKAIP